VSQKLLWVDQLLYLFSVQSLRRLQQSLHHWTLMSSPNLYKLLHLWREIYINIYIKMLISVYTDTILFIFIDCAILSLFPWANSAATCNPCVLCEQKYWLSILCISGLTVTCIKLLILIYFLICKVQRSQNIQTLFFSNQHN